MAAYVMKEIRRHGKKRTKSSQILTNSDTYFSTEFQPSVGFSFCDEVSRGLKINTFELRDASTDGISRFKTSGTVNPSLILSLIGQQWNNIDIY